MKGQEVRTLFHNHHSAANFIVKWKSTNNFRNVVAAAVYLYQIEMTSQGIVSYSFVVIKKLILINNFFSIHSDELKGAR